MAHAFSCQFVGVYHVHVYNVNQIIALKLAGKICGKIILVKSFYFHRFDSNRKPLLGGACERSGKWSGAGRKTNEREPSAEREIRERERERSDERAN
jgi:hypothetical protein